MFASTAAVYSIAFAGLKFFSQFSLMQISTNCWTFILAIAIADFIYYWEHRVKNVQTILPNSTQGTKLRL